METNTPVHLSGANSSELEAALALVATSFGTTADKLARQLQVPNPTIGVHVGAFLAAINKNSRRTYATHLRRPSTASVRSAIVRATCAVPGHCRSRASASAAPACRAG